MCWCSQASMRDDWAACTDHVALQRTSTHRAGCDVTPCTCGKFDLADTAGEQPGCSMSQSPGNVTMLLAKLFEPCAAHGTHDYQNVGARREDSCGPMRGKCWHSTILCPCLVLILSAGLTSLGTVPL